MIYNPNRGPVVTGIMVMGILAGLAGIHKTYQEGLAQYREENPYAGMPSEFQEAMGSMGLEYAYTGEVNTEIEQMLQRYDVVDTAEASVIRSNGQVYRVTVTLTGKGWMQACEALAEEIRKLYPNVTVTFYDSNVNTIYSE